MIKEFLEKVFTKAESDTGIVSLRGKCEYISEYLLENFKFSLSYKTLERYYKGETAPKGETNDVLAKFLGYDNFNDFLIKNQFTSQKKFENNDFKRTFATNGMTRWILILLIPLIGGAGYIGYINGSEKCMIWVDDHYETKDCDGAPEEVEYNKNLLNNFREIEANNNTEFFKNGEVQVWYDKNNHELYYFTSPGINPETHHTVKPITQYMIHKYILKDSLK